VIELNSQRFGRHGMPNDGGRLSASRPLRGVPFIDEKHETGANRDARAQCLVARDRRHDGEPD